MAGSVVSQRWKVYDYEKEKNTNIREGEVIMVQGTPDFPKVAVSLTGDGVQNVEGLYNQKMS